MRQQLTGDPKSAIKWPRPVAWLLCVIALVPAAGYLACVNDQWWPTPDSALYLGLGKSLAEGHGYQFNGHTDNTVAPGLPLVLAGLRMMSGADGWWAANLLMAICGLGAGAFIYLSLARLSGRPMALGAAAATLCCYLFFWYSHLILTDAPFILLAYAILWLALRYLSAGGASLWWAAGLTAVALTIRTPGAVMLGPMAVGLALAKSAPRRRRLMLAAVMLGMILVVDGLWFAIAKSISSYVPYEQSVAENLGQFAGGFWQRAAASVSQEWLNLGKLFAGRAAAHLGMAAGALVLLGMAATCRRGVWVLTVTTVSHLLLVMLTLRSDLPDRYLLPVAPMLILLAMEGAGAVWALMLRLLAIMLRPIAVLRAGRWSRALHLAAPLALACAVIVGNAPAVRQYMHWECRSARNGEFYADIECGRYAELFAMADVVGAERPDSCAIVESDKAKMIHYLTGRRVIEVPMGRNLTPEDANDVLQLCRRQSQAQVFLVRHAGGEDYYQAVRRLFAERDDMEMLYDGVSHMIYRRK